MKKSLIALAFGTLALGIAEFVMMGILPDVARSLGVSIPEAGRLISAYAVGVCCGAPLLVVVHKYPLKNILLALSCMILLGSTLAAFSANYWMLLAARFISGLPHGAYFGVASIVAVRLADEHPDKGFRHQFAFLKSDAPWLILAATMLANGGIFCWYSYVSPLLISGGFSADTLPALMIAAGFGMVAGNMISGRLCDHHRPGHVVATTQCVAIATLLLIFWLADCGWLSAALMVVCTGCLFAVSSPQQFLILKYAPGGELLGGASIQVAFNLGNALGAFCGGLPIAAGLPPRYAALAGVPFVMLGLLSFVIFCRKYEKAKA